MAKPKSPLLSLGARGTIADSLTFQRQRRRTIAREKPIPKDPKSVAQLAWRQIYRNAVAAWHALSAAEKEAWRGVCPGLTPYQCFMRSELKYVPPPPPELTLYEYYNTGDVSWVAVWEYVWVAQTFTPLTPHKITLVKLKLQRSYLPGIVTVGIRATDLDGHPIGDDLCLGTTDGDTLTEDVPGEWREVALGDGYNLNADTKYAIVVRAPTATGVNYIKWRADDSYPTYIRGNEEQSNDSGLSWYSRSGIDLMFEDWGYPL